MFGSGIRDPRVGGQGARGISAPHMGVGGGQFSRPTHPRWGGDWPVSSPWVIKTFYIKIFFII